MNNLGTDNIIKTKNNPAQYLMGYTILATLKCVIINLMALQKLQM